MWLTPISDDVLWHVTSQVKPMDLHKIANIEISCSSTLLAHYSYPWALLAVCFTGEFTNVSPRCLLLSGVECFEDTIQTFRIVGYIAGVRSWGVSVKRGSIVYHSVPDKYSTIINPRCMHQRITVVVLCVCLSVWLCYQASCYCNIPRLQVQSAVL